MTDELTIDIQKQCILAIDCLDAMLPYCVQGGITVLRDDAYDEWEGLVQAVYFSFLVYALSDAGIMYPSSEFHKLGFQVSKPKHVIKLQHSNMDYFISDFSTNDLTEGVFLEVLPYPFCGGDEPIFIKPSEGMGFSVALVKP